jgi:glycosyltransferase involved in cell wall biosynthesis
MKKNLMLVTVGNNSLHREWASCEDRNFDIMFIYYADGREIEYEKDCDFLVKDKGFKFKIIGNFLVNHWDKIKNYEYICFSDDDLSANANSFNVAFDRAKQYDLWIAQPSLSLDSYTSHPELYQINSNILRYSSFVELMTPIIKIDILEKITPTIVNPSTDWFVDSGWGLDYLWFDLLGAPINKFAIIDEVCVKHTKPYRGYLEQFGYPKGINEHEDWGKVCKMFPHTNHGKKIFKTIEKPMEKITFCIPSKNNLRYLKACIPSIRKNAKRTDHDIAIFVDKDEDGTVKWLESVKDMYNLKYYVNPDLNNSLFGIGKAYDYCIERANTDIFMIFHADMMLGKYADYEAFKYLSPSKVVCSTRIEPPLHPEGVEKIIQDFGLWPELDGKDGFKEKEFDEYVEKCKRTYVNKTTQGCFAPWMMYKKDFMAIGMHDAIMKSAREDSDVFNRMILNKYELIQSWQSFVYHLTCRGGQFEHGVLTKDHSQKSKDWQLLMHQSTLEFIRKWGSTVKHDEYLNPIIKNKYNIGLVIKNSELTHLELLEPWCSTLYTDYYGYKSYNEVHECHTSFNLWERVKPLQAEKINDIIIEFDGNQLTQERFMFLTEQLSDVLTDSGEIGEMEYDIFKITIKSLKTYQNDLIICK